MGWSAAFSTLFSSMGFGSCVVVIPGLKRGLKAGLGCPVVGVVVSPSGLCDKVWDPRSEVRGLRSDSGKFGWEASFIAAVALNRGV